MKRNPLLLAFAATLILFATSCKKGGKTGLLVPKEAAAVLYLNTGSLASKLSWEEIKKSEWFQEAQRDATDSFAKKVLNDPAVSGVDIEKGFALAVVPRGRGMYISFQGSIKDQAAFEEMLKNAKGNRGEQKKSGDINVLVMDNNDGVILSWNKSNFLLIADAPSNTTTGMTARFPKDSLILFANSTFSLKGKDLLDADSKFADLIQSKGDVHMWYSAANFYNSVSMGMMDMLKMSTLTEGNYGTGTLSFDDGKISLNGKQYYGKELTKIFDKYSTKGASSELTGRLPNGDVMVAGVYSYPMGSLIDMIKLIGADGLANMFLGQKGITMEDIGKAFKGDLAFSVTDVKEVVDTAIGITRHEPNYVFGMAIDDQKSFDKLYNLFNEDLNKVPSQMASIKTEKGWLTVSNSPELTSGFLAGNNKPAYADKISGHLLGVYVNIQKILTSAQRESRDSSSLKVLEVSKATWQDVVSSADYKGGVGSFQIEVNMVDKATNSLKQLNSYSDKLAAIHKAERAQYQVDTTAISAEAPPKAFN